MFIKSDLYLIISNGIFCMFLNKIILFPKSLSLQNYGIRKVISTYSSGSFDFKVRPGSSHSALSWTNIVIVFSLALNSTISSTLTELLIIIGHGFEGKLES